MKKLLSAILVIYLISASSSIMAQTVILLNGEPTKVILKETSIVEVLDDDVSDYMNGYDTTLPGQKNAYALETYNQVISPLRMFVVREREEIATSTED